MPLKKAKKKATLICMVQRLFLCLKKTQSALIRIFLKKLPVEKKRKYRTARKSVAKYNKKSIYYIFFYKILSYCFKWRIL